VSNQQGTTKMEAQGRFLRKVIKKNIFLRVDVQSGSN